MVLQTSWTHVATATSTSRVYYRLKMPFNHKWSFQKLAWTMQRGPFISPTYALFHHIFTCQCNSAVISAKLCRHQHQTRVITCLIITCLIISGHLLDSPFIQSKIFSDLFNGSSKLREQMIKTITFAHTCNVQIGMTNTTVLMCNTKPSTC